MLFSLFMPESSLQIYPFQINIFLASSTSSVQNHFTFTYFKLIIFLFSYQMNWLRANRLSAKDPLTTASFSSGLRQSVDPKMKNSQDSDLNTPDKIKSNPSFSLEKINAKTIENTKSSLSTVLKKKDAIKLPSLKKGTVSDINPESQTTIEKSKDIFYQTQIYKALQMYESTYLMTLARQHFYQTIEALRITKNIRLLQPKKQIKLQKKSPHKKTIYLDLDETLIHTDERSGSYSVKLTFPIETGGSIQAGVRIRPFCKQFLIDLAKIAEVIIFTASSSSYADVILDYLDPEKKIFSHRLYRNHCTLEKGYYIKDLRAVNRNLQDVAIVDNSAFSFLLQPWNGIPIIPFYHFSRDQQLLSLLEFLKQLVKQQDCRNLIKRTFFWEVYLKDNTDPRKIFSKRYKKQFEDKIE